MKARWLQLAARFDALSERERILAFLAVAALLVFGVQAAVLGPLARKETLLRTQVLQAREQTGEIDRAIAEQARAFAVDPDRPLVMRLSSVQGDAERLAGRLRTMERGLVAPERMAPLLESMMRANGRLRMVSMKTLPATPLSAVMKDADASTGAGPVAPAAVQPAVQPALPAAVAAAAPGVAAALAQGAAPDPAKAVTLAPPPAPPPQEPELLYRHGVELTVRGGYLDLVDYMTTLETLPTQLFWGRAQLEVEQYPTARLTLTLYTMSLDDQWMKL